MNLSGNLVLNTVMAPAPPLHSWRTKVKYALDNAIARGAKRQETDAMNDWFHDLTGLDRDDPATVRSKVICEGPDLVSMANGRRMRAGHLSLPKLDDLRARGSTDRGSALDIAEITGDAIALHVDPDNAGAVFQVASQFNLLEMISPDVTPEQGIARYAIDRTQGPACAMACGAGTLYRNYLVPLPGQTGQSSARQIDTVADLHRALAGSGRPDLWVMRNGYLLPTERGLARAAEEIIGTDIGGLIRVGVQADTEVTLDGTGHRVTQVYCSAAPVAYSGHPSASWEPLARLILDAAYEATFHVALAQSDAGGSNRLFLTALGGGAFGNPPDWIAGAIGRAARLFARSGLEARLVGFGAPTGLLRRAGLA